MRRRDDLRPIFLNAEAALAQHTRQHVGGGGVERVATADREDRRVDHPTRRKLIALDHGQLAVLVLAVLCGGERGKSARFLLVLAVLLRRRTKLGEPAAWLEIGEVVHHLLDRVGDLHLLVAVDRAALVVALSELQAGQRDLVEIGLQNSGP